MAATGSNHKDRLTRDDILLAIKNTKSNRQAATYLNVAKQTYKKYASMFRNEDGKTLYEIHNNKYNIGVRKKLNLPKKTKLNDIITGKIPATNIKFTELKDQVIREGLIEEKCACCGFSERRTSDQKVPILLNFRDGNKRNWHPDNLEPLCHNCYFLIVGDIYTRRQKETIESAATSMEGLENVLDLSKDQLKIVEEKYINTGEDLIQKY